MAIDFSAIYEIQEYVFSPVVPTASRPATVTVPARNNLSVLDALRITRDRMIAFPQSLRSWAMSPWDGDGNACLTQHLCDVMYGQKLTPSEAVHIRVNPQLFTDLGAVLNIPGGAIYQYLYSNESVSELRLRIDRAISRLEEHEIGPEAPVPTEPEPVPDEQPVEAELMAVAC